MESAQARTREHLKAWRKAFEAIPFAQLKTPADLDTWLKECLRLNAYEDMYGGRLSTEADVKEDDRTEVGRVSTR